MLGRPLRRACAQRPLRSSACCHAGLHCCALRWTRPLAARPIARGLLPRSYCAVRSSRVADARTTAKAKQLRPEEPIRQAAEQPPPAEHRFGRRLG